MNVEVFLNKFPYLSSVRFIGQKLNCKNVSNHSVLFLNMAPHTFFVSQTLQIAFFKSSQFAILPVILMYFVTLLTWGEGELQK